MTSAKIMAAGAIAAACIAGPAAAQDAGRWFVHAGPAVVQPDESAKMTAGGSPLAGAGVAIGSKWTAEAEVGYFVTPNIALAAAAGYPPTFTVNAAGSIAGVGKIGEMTGGPAGLLVQYHFNREGALQPYVGAGASFLVVFDTKDAALSNLKAKSAVGTALQVGANYWFSERMGAFVDVKKAYVETTATGSLGGAPVRAKVKVDPLVTNFGVAWRF
ncbi:OmpW family protein [Phenylobacterium sp.]|jgi:outer membrane protein|uniref:OmpW family protein n=1 Tax=Phenylobacterium sp. TaxID=1871053 RepID=UPI003784109B